jgi:hypothetical protein
MAEIIVSIEMKTNEDKLGLVFAKLSSSWG